MGTTRWTRLIEGGLIAVALAAVLGLAGALVGRSQTPAPGGTPAASPTETPWLAVPGTASVQFADINIPPGTHEWMLEAVVRNADGTTTSYFSAPRAIIVPAPAATPVVSRGYITFTMDDGTTARLRLELGEPRR